jgi:hypothetical protein
LADVKVDEKLVFAQKTAEALLFRLAQVREQVEVAAEVLEQYMVASHLRKGEIVATRVVVEMEAEVCSQAESKFATAVQSTGQISGGHPLPFVGG